MGKLSWFLFLVCLGAVAVLAQLDRQARYDPALAPWVPSMFAGFAHSHLAEAAIQADDLDRATGLSRQLVSQRPIPAENLVMLARAQLASGQRLDAAGSLQLAARGGWRDLNGQQAMLALAINAGDERQAGRHLAALWALSRDRELLAELSPAILSVPDARESFAKIVAGARWKNDFPAKAASVLPPSIFASTISSAIGAGADFDCSVLRGAAQTMIIKNPSASPLVSEVLMRNNCKDTTQ